MTTAGVIQSGFVIAPLDSGAGIAGDAYFWYAGSLNAWQQGAACATEIYLPAGDAFPWVLVGAAAPTCNLTSRGIWYPTYPRNEGAPSYVLIPAFDASQAPTSFSVDSSGNVYTTGGTGTACTTGGGIPYGPCIQRHDGTGWASLAGSPGAQQVTSDDTVLYALDQSHAIWFVDFPGSASWLPIGVTSICGGGTLKPDLIAANSGFLFAIDDAGGGAGAVYSLSVSGSTCWSPVDDSVRMMSISANPQLNGANSLLGTDASNGLWFYCNGNTP